MNLSRTLSTERSRRLGDDQSALRCSHCFVGETEQPAARGPIAGDIASKPRRGSTAVAPERFVGETLAPVLVGADFRTTLARSPRPPRCRYESGCEEQTWSPPGDTRGADCRASHSISAGRHRGAARRPHSRRRASRLSHHGGHQVPRPDGLPHPRQVRAHRPGNRAPGRPESHCRKSPRRLDRLNREGHEQASELIAKHRSAPAIRTQTSGADLPELKP